MLQSFTFIDQAFLKGFLAKNSLSKVYKVAFWGILKNFIKLHGKVKKGDLLPKVLFQIGIIDLDYLQWG